MSRILAVQPIQEEVTDMWRSLLLFIPKALAFIAILVAGWLVARFALKIVNKALRRVGLDHAVERGGIGRVLRGANYHASDIIAKLVYYGILLLTLQLAFGVWGPNPVSDLIASVVAWLPRAFVAIVIVVVAAAIANAVRDLIQAALSGLSYGGLLGNVASIFIIGLGVIAALNQVGIATTVTTPVLIAVLATVGGILIVGVGGGLVRPMQQRWEGWLARAAVESQVIREKAQAFSAERADLARERAAQQQMDDATEVIRRDPPVAAGGPGQPSAAAWGATAPDGYAMPTQTREMPASSTDPERTQAVPGVPAPPAEPGRTQTIYKSGNLAPARIPQQPGSPERSGPVPDVADLGAQGEVPPRPLGNDETQRINPQDPDR